MNKKISIQDAATLSGASPKMIRNYERIGLITKPARGHNNYRSYDDRQIHELAFIRRARELGFPIQEIRALLALWRDRDRPSSEVKAIALAQIAELDTKVEALRAMSASLRHLAAACQGDNRPECPILDELAGD